MIVETKVFRESCVSLLDLLRLHLKGIQELFRVLNNLTICSLLRSRTLDFNFVK